MAAGYVPERGDLVWLAFTPQAGSGQAGRRQALIMSPKAYIQKVGLALICPISSQLKGYPFEVPIPDGLDVGGVLFSDQLKSLDWRARKARLIARASAPLILQVTGRILLLLNPDQ